MYDLIRERLLEGGFAAGERISLEALKSEFEVSKQPVMDAMRRLASDGLVEIIPQVGCRVPTYHSGEVRDFYTMFAGMEGAIAGVAAERWTGRQAAELRELNARIGALAGDADVATRSHGYRLMNREFHARIHLMAASRVVSDMSQRIWDFSDLLINTAGVRHPMADTVPERVHDHDVICDAIAARDPNAARVAMQQHILGTVPIIGADADEADTGS